MRKIFLMLFILFSLSACNTFSNEKNIQQVDNTKVVKLAQDWKQATKADKLRLSFELAERYVKTIEAAPKFVSSEVVERVGDYEKIIYIFQVEDIQYKIEITSKEDRRVTMWQIISHVVAIIIGAAAAPQTSGLSFLL